MTKQEFELKYREIVLNTNGGNDDYVVALCQIGNLINELDDQSQQITELKQQLEEKDKEIAELEEITDSIVSTAYYKLARTAEIKKLKHQLRTQPKEIVGKIREPINQLEYGILKRYKEESVVSEWDSMKLECYDQTLKILQEILKEYGGEE